MGKCRILFVVNGMNMGGIENFVMNVVRNLDLDRFYAEFLYCDKINSYFDEEITSLGFKISRITSRSENLFNHLKELKAFFKNNTYDVVHINYSNAFCFTAARAAKKAGIKKIIVHSHSSLSYGEKLHNLLKPVLCHYANMYFSCSDKASEWMFTKKITENNQVVMINNAIDTKKYLFNEQNRKKIREEFHLDDKFVVGHIGRLSEVKNHKFLLEIFSKFLEKNKNSALLLVGDGELRDTIDNYAKELGIRDNVIFAGIRGDIPQILCAMDCFVMPSFYEGLPVTLVEVQASGLSCITSDIVTRDVEITDLIKYYSLEKTALEWADMIVGSNNREKYNEIVGLTDFDIKQEIKLIENLYEK